MKALGKVVEMRPVSETQVMIGIRCEPNVAVLLYLPVEDAVGITYLQECEVTVEWRQGVDPHIVATIKRPHR
jgi:hypothetical protein